MDRTCLWRWAAVGGVVVVAGVAPMGGAGIPQRDFAASAATTRAVMSAAQIAAMPLPAQSALLAPLRRLAGDLDAQGRTRYAASYSGVRIEAGRDVVELYATSLAGGRSLLAGAVRSDPTAPWTRVETSSGRFARATLDRDADRLLSADHPSGLSAVAVPPDGTGLDVEVAPQGSRVVTADPPGSASARVSAMVVAAAARAGVAVPIRVTTVAARQAKSWRQDKWQDSTPFIGGDVLTSNGHNACTAGLPAVRRSDNVPVLITAAHCFATGTRVYTGAGPAGSYGNGLTGNYVGTVGTRIKHWDAEPLVGANNNADESDTTWWKPLTSVAYSYDGDFVCQDGAYSFYLGHPTPCGIEVTDQDIYFSIGGYTARGVEGIDVRNGWGSHDGDSGGTVFSYEPGNVRQARGIISSGGLDGTPDQKRVDWTEAVDIFRAFDLKLNPQT